MITPIEIQSKTFKSGGLGYDKKDVDSFFREVQRSYESVYRENMELSDKVNVLTEGIQYYKTIEKTLQKALVLAEKTAEDTRIAAEEKAKNIEREARSRSQMIVADAKNELERIHNQTIALIQQYEKYKLQFKKLAEAQMEMIQSEAFNINVARLDTFINVNADSGTQSADDQAQTAGTQSAGVKAQIAGNQNADGSEHPRTAKPTAGAQTADNPRPTRQTPKDQSTGYEPCYDDFDELNHHNPSSSNYQSKSAKNHNPSKHVDMSGMVPGPEDFEADEPQQEAAAASEVNSFDNNDFDVEFDTSFMDSYTEEAPKNSDNDADDYDYDDDDDDELEDIEDERKSEKKHKKHKKGKSDFSFFKLDDEED